MKKTQREILVGCTVGALMSLYIGGLGVADTTVSKPLTYESVKETVEVSVPEIAEPEIAEMDRYMYTHTVLNVRDGGSIDAEKLGCLNIATKIHVTGCLDGWYRIDYHGGSAWVCGDYVADNSPVMKVSSTAYWERDSSHSASGKTLKKGISIAGKVSWLGKKCEIYRCKDDGSVGKYLGEYSFDDTGYGAESGYGSSKILKGRSIGTIENGTCIDFYMDNEKQCMEYGRRDVYIKFVD